MVGFPAWNCSYPCDDPNSHPAHIKPMFQLDPGQEYLCLGCAQTHTLVYTHTHSPHYFSQGHTLSSHQRLVPPRAGSSPHGTPAAQAPGTHAAPWHRTHQCSHIRDIVPHISVHQFTQAVHTCTTQRSHTHTNPTHSLQPSLGLVTLRVVMS